MILTLMSSRAFNFLNDMVKSSVADTDPVFLGYPDPDPGNYQIRILYPQKDPPGLLIFSFYKICKRQFSQNYVFIHDFKFHKMFGIKMP